MLNLREEDRLVVLSISDCFKKNKLEKPYLVGGVVRDYFLKREYGDIDITNNSGGQSFLGGLFFARENLKDFKISKKGYVTIISEDHSKIDFSSGMLAINSEVDLSETESRNFTINSILYDIQEDKIVDEFGGLDDIKNRLIRTIMPASASLMENENRVIKCVELATKFNFAIDEEIVSFYKDNKPYIKYCFEKNKKYLFGSFAKAMAHDEDYFLNIVFNLDIFKIIPLAGKYKELLIRKKLLGRYIDD